MIQCTPQGICSWNYRLSSASHHAEIEFNWAGEEGRITVDGVRHQVCKQGWLSGTWTLEADSEVLVEAIKQNPFSRTIDLKSVARHQSEDQAYVLEACSTFSRQMAIRGRGFDCVIAAVHPFTRRATISGTIPDFRVACFGFWLTALLWRRQQNSSSG